MGDERDHEAEQRGHRGEVEEGNDRPEGLIVHRWVAKKRAIPVTSAEVPEQHKTGQGQAEDKPGLRTNTANGRPPMEKDEDSQTRGPPDQHVDKLPLLLVEKPQAITRDDQQREAAQHQAQRQRIAARGVLSHAGRARRKQSAQPGPCRPPARPIGLAGVLHQHDDTLAHRRRGPSRRPCP
jgi:hypothetical protein